MDCITSDPGIKITHMILQDLGNTKDKCAISHDTSTKKELFLIHVLHLLQETSECQSNSLYMSFFSHLRQ